VAAESRVDNKLLFVVWFRKLEQENLGRKVVYVGESKSHQAFLELMGNDLCSTIRIELKVVALVKTYFDIQRRESLLHFQLLLSKPRHTIMKISSSTSDIVIVGNANMGYRGVGSWRGTMLTSSRCHVIEFPHINHHLGIHVGKVSRYSVKTLTLKLDLTNRNESGISSTTSDQHTTRLFLNGFDSLGTSNTSDQVGP
jgi:hypothetical protein